MEHNRAEKQGYTNKDIMEQLGIKIKHKLKLG